MSKAGQPRDKGELFKMWCTREGGAFMDTLSVMFTMDCEALASMSAEGGPESWEMAQRSIAGFSSILFESGYKPTLFIVPAAASKLSGILLDMEKAGAQLGLHLHPQDEGYSDYLGAYTFDRQLKMIKEAVDKWSDALGMLPDCFRGGNLSANDNTFPALAQCGFTEGSLSVSGRSFTRAKSNWTGAPQYAYRTDPANRLLEGDMDFLEIPITADWESVMWGGLTKLELRIEMVDARSHGFTVRKNIDRQITEGVGNKYLLSLTHNIFDYSDPSEFRTGVLKGVIDEIHRHSEKVDLTVEGEALGQYRKRFFL